MYDAGVSPWRTPAVLDLRLVLCAMLGIAARMHLPVRPAHCGSARVSMDVQDTPILLCLLS